MTRDPTNKDRLASAVEGTLTLVSRVRHAAQGFVRLYNTMAEHAPIPLPKLPDGSRRVWPKDAYTPPPPRPAPTPTRPTPSPMPKTEAPRGATAPPANGLVVELAGPSVEEYRASLGKPEETSG